MSTTITIPPELEEQIAARASAEGKDVEEFALEALARAASTPSVRELFAEVREEIHRRGITPAEIDSEIESAVNEVRERRRA